MLPSPSTVELPIQEAALDLVRWFIPVLHRLPRLHRHGLGDRLQRLAGHRTAAAAGGAAQLHRPAPGSYRQFRIRDPKPRRISAVPYRDRVVHHALCVSDGLHPCPTRKGYRDNGPA
jgi:hypothetical protein